LVFKTATVGKAPKVKKDLYLWPCQRRQLPFIRAKVRLWKKRPANCAISVLFGIQKQKNMATQSLPAKLSWTKKAFERITQLTYEGKVVGEIKREGAFSHDVVARLHHTQVRFDVMGFLIHEVAIQDVIKDNEVLGHIKFDFGKKATLTLKNGEIYVWKRASFLMKQWHLIHDLPNTDNDPEVINYARTQHVLFGEEGEISILEQSENADLLVLSGLFVRNYFLRRRRLAAAMAAS
jgi:hypothetical protein